MEMKARGYGLKGRGSWSTPPASSHPPSRMVARAGEIINNSENSRHVIKLRIPEAGQVVTMRPKEKAAAFASSIAEWDGPKLATQKLVEHFAVRRS